MALFLLQNVTWHRNIKTVLDPMLFQRVRFTEHREPSMHSSKLLPVPRWKTAARSRHTLPKQLMPPMPAAACPASASLECPGRDYRPEDLFCFVSLLPVAVFLCLCYLLGEGPQGPQERHCWEWAAGQAGCPGRQCTSSVVIFATASNRYDGILDLQLA